MRVTSHREAGHRGRSRLAFSLTAALIALVFIVGGLLVLLTRSDEGKKASGRTSYRPLEPFLPEIARLEDALRSSASGRLFSVVSAELRGSSRGAFRRIVKRGIARTGRVRSVRMSAPAKSRPTAEGGLGFMTMRLRYATGPKRTYRAYFVYERGAWRLLTTTRQRT